MLCFHAQNSADEFQFLNALKEEYWLEDSVIVVERQTDRKELTIRVRGIRMFYEIKPYIFNNDSLYYETVFLFPRIQKCVSRLFKNTHNTFLDKREEEKVLYLDVI